MNREEQWVLKEKYNGVATPGFQVDKDRLAAGEPVAYVIGWQPFLGMKVWLDSPACVGRKPLIPRPETEWWVESLLRNLSERSGSDFGGVSQRDGTRPSDFSAEKYATPEVASGLRVVRALDLCAGSGAIGCGALKYLPNAKVYFGEIDPAHEATIWKNINENSLDKNQAEVRIGDLFAPFAGEQFDLILTNPPYIPTERPLETSVADFEPSLALRAGGDGLEVLRRIAKDLRTYLAPQGEAWIECDSEHAESAEVLFKKEGFATKILNDQYDRSRVIVVS